LAAATTRQIVSGAMKRLLGDLQAHPVQQPARLAN
jgi:hypothetical protein